MAASSTVARGPTVTGQVKEVGKRSLTLAIRPARGEEAAAERTVDVAEDALIVVHDGKVRRLSARLGKFADIVPGTMAIAGLSVDHSQITVLHIHGPNVTGLLKAVDPAKSSITIAIPKGRGEEPEEKTFAVAKDARITIDNNASKLADLKVADNGPVVQLHLSLDQKTVQSIMTRTTGRPSSADTSGMLDGAMSTIAMSRTWRLTTHRVY